MAMTEKEMQYRRLMMLRQKAIRRARADFWAYCKLESPKFFREDRWHLKLNAVVLQALYERRLTRELFIASCESICPAWFLETESYADMIGRLIPGKVYTRHMMNEPPRTGKSRILVNFTKWCLGKDQESRIITCSYADGPAQDFSRYTRDGIMQTKTYPHETVFNDVFPHCVVQDGNASYKQWALEGQFFNYKGAGIGGSITGKGCKISIVDDPVKDADEALNELRLDTIWTWYTGTFLSRMEEEDGIEGIEIVNMTRWAAGDVCGRILGDDKNPGPDCESWFVLTLEASYGEGDNMHMLCDSLLSRTRYERLKRTMVPEIFFANYHQRPLDLQGRLYKKLKTYNDVPRDEEGRPLFERIIAYGDTADEGSDFLCSIVAGVYSGEAYLVDVLYTKEGMEVTEPATARQMHENSVSYAMIESNNGGRGFARAVERLLWDTYKSRQTIVKWFHQSKNKRARIITASAFVQEHVYFPANWHDRWPDFYTAITTYQKDGKNKNDDGPDALTGITEVMDKRSAVGVVNVKL